jgi:hypothetical protein
MPFTNGRAARLQRIEANLRHAVSFTDYEAVFYVHAEIYNIIPTDFRKCAYFTRMNHTDRSSFKDQPDRQRTNSEEVTISVGQSHLFAVLLTVPLAFFFGLLFVRLWGVAAFSETIRTWHGRQIRLVLLLLAGVMAHELLHGLTWACFCTEGLKSVRFGVKWAFLTPYAHCKEALPKRHYQMGTVMPAIVLGIFPLVFSLISGQAFCLFWGILFIGAAGGDIWAWWKLRTYSSESRVLDHPDELGFLVEDPARR